MRDRVPIRRLATGVPGLDDVLGGGIPEFSFNLIAGGPGCGKTTLGHQIMFSNATLERKAIFFTIIGEPPIKMLRYQQQFAFFDAAKVEASIRFVHLGDEAREGGLAAVLARIEKEVNDTSPAMVLVDSFRSMFRRADAHSDGTLEVQDFIQRLAVLLTNCEATTFMLGEYRDSEHDNPIFTVADGIVWLYQDVDRNSIVRKLHVVKMRGLGQIPGLHTARISDLGFNVFPRLLKPENATLEGHPLEHRLSTGIPPLDEMMHGGIPRGYSVLVAGPSGSGKTVLSNQFLVEGVRRGEPGIVAVFEKRPQDYLQTTPQGREFEKMLERGELEIVYLRPLDLSIDETLLALRDAVKRIGARRAVIDSLSGLELALAPTFRDDFRESMYRMMGALTGTGVTVMATVELQDLYTGLQFSPQGVAFLTDAILIQRYIEIEGQLKRAISVVKVRSSPHSKDLREYEISEEGLLIMKEAMTGYEGILTGAASKLVGPESKAKKRDEGQKKGGGAERPRDAPSDAELSRAQRDMNEQLVLSNLRAQEETDAAEASEREARASEEGLRTFADMIPILAWYADPDGAMRWYNRRWFEYTGTALATQEGSQWQSGLDPQDLARIVAKWKTALATGEPWEDEFRLRQADGTFHWFLARAKPLRDAQGRIVRWFGTNVDIDGQRRASEERALSLASEQTAREEAEASNRIKDEFLATMSHELRTPLTAILGWSSLLRRGTYDKKSFDRALATIERNARAQARLIEDLLDVSRIISGKLKLELGRVDANAIASEAIDVVRPAADAKRVRLVVELAPLEEAMLVGDADRLQQVIWNLLSNAVKFTPPEGTVSLRVEGNGSHARFTVRDNGAGIPPEHLPFIFDRFRQVDSSTTRRFAGLGLGLGIVRHLVEMHGGLVTVESGGLGRGSTFSVSLPIRDLDEVAAKSAADAESDSMVASQDRPPSIPLPAPTALAGVRILVVDDDEDTRFLIQCALERAGATVSTADSARAAMARIEDHVVDLMISDIGMPEEDGFSLMQRVRLLPANHGGQMPALALTAYTRGEDAERARRVGYQDHLAKPADVDDITRSVVRLMKTWPASPVKEWSA